jgi:hypothetical protein
MARVLKVGNVGTKFTTTIIDAETGAPVNLTGGTVTFYFKLGSKMFSKAGTLLVAASGTVESAATSAGDLDRSGTLFYMAKVVLSGSTFNSEDKSEQVLPNLYG